MTALELLERLRRLDIRVWLEGERVRLSAPSGVLTPGLQAQLRERQDEIVEFLRKVDGRAGPRSAMVPLQPHGSRSPFFGIPGHGGQVVNFAHLARALDPDQPFYAYQPPGFDKKEAPLTRIEDLAEHFTSELRACQAEGPYRIGGYCTGGLIAFEAARMLTDQGAEVRSVVLFGTSAPTSRTLRHRALTLPVRILNRGIRLTRERSRGSEASEEQAAPDDVSRTLLERTTSTAARSYAAGMYRGRVVLFIPSRNWRGLTCERYLDWDRFTAQEIQVHSGPAHGVHRTMLHEPFVAGVAELLGEELDSR